MKVGVSICEDAWSPTGPILAEAAGGAELIVNLNASPYYAQRLVERETMLATRAADASVPIVYANLVGGQDELVFDGASLVFDEQGVLRRARAKQFATDLLVVDIDVRRRSASASSIRAAGSRRSPLPEIHVSDRRPADARASPPDRARPRTGARGVRGARARHPRLRPQERVPDVVIGLSGGIDSALVAAIAVDALGADHVSGVLMPSRYSSDHSVSDADALAANLGIKSFTVPIEPAHAAFESMLAPMFEGTPPGLAEENVQARIRGNVVAAATLNSPWPVLHPAGGTFVVP